MLVMWKTMTERAAQARLSLIRRHVFVAAFASMFAVGCAGHATATVPRTTVTAVPHGTLTPRTMRPPLPTRPAPIEPPPTLVRTALTAADNGATVIARPGQVITLTLAPAHMGNWDRPIATSALVLRLDSVTGGYPSQQALLARVSVVGRGRSDIMTRTDIPCLHSHPACLPPQYLWQVHVIVR